MANPRRRRERAPWPTRETIVPKTSAPKKLRVYEVAKDLVMSSEAVLQIVKRRGVEVNNHMSTLPAETVAKVQGEMAQERTAVREEMTRKHEQEVQRAREDRARAAAAAHAAAPPAPKPLAQPRPGRRSPPPPPPGRGERENRRRGIEGHPGHGVHHRGRACEPDGGQAQAGRAQLPRAGLY